ncbi:hypothetical protein G4G27_07520 [Sphingomonas sp. So64.6b]|uniref:hypothetical protein n=1 Tax=Sphingomonas sp. So64.6b TaxID=2997354 RepID=UPI0016026EDA|nr:hypothetical protein [Sphingomonas sp. So64.6b]QNA83851.1 hypothetical protein G4G27_07520 [Sphingomonas sp. So64.6b]
MTAPIFDLTAKLKAKADITSEDTLAMRRLAWPDGLIDPAEADAIFDLNTSVKGKSRDWVDFFVEAMTVYLVEQQEPKGYIDEAKASWLMAKIDSDGRVDSLGELELLVKLLETAINVPDTLKSYALSQIEAIVLTGTGPTRDGGSLDAGSVSPAEAKLLRRLLFAQGGDGPALVSRAEADMLFRLKDATLAATNAPEWSTLFVQAVGNHLMAHGDYHPLDRERAVELNTFMSDTRSSVGGFFGGIAGSNVAPRFSTVFGRKGVPRDRDADVAADRAIVADEKSWLTSRLEADHALDSLEQALLEFIASESGAPAL